MPETKPDPECWRLIVDKWCGEAVCTSGHLRFRLYNPEGLLRAKHEATGRTASEAAQHDYRHLAAAANACRGLSTEELEAGLIDDLIEVAVLARSIVNNAEEHAIALSPQHWQLIDSVYERLQGRVTKGGSV